MLSRKCILWLVLAEDGYDLTENKLGTKIFFADMLPLGVLCQNPELHRNSPIGSLENPRWPPKTHKSMAVHKFHEFREGSFQSIYALRGVKCMDIYTNQKSGKKRDSNPHGPHEHDPWSPGNHNFTILWDNFINNLSILMTIMIVM